MKSRMVALGAVVFWSACGDEGGSSSPDAVVIDASDVDAVEHDAGRVDASTGACFPIEPLDTPHVRHALALQTRGGLHVYAEVGGQFQSLLSEPGFTHFAHAAWGDVDGDGIDELATHWFWLPPGMSPGGVQIYGDHGSGLAVQQTILGDSPGSLAWTDIDGDGHHDLWLDDGFTQIQCSDGQRLRHCWSMRSATNVVYQVVFGDGDHDGDLDVAVKAFNEVIIYRNTGGQFARAARFEVDVSDLDWVELDGCAGDELVLLVGTFTDRSLRVLRWDGTTYEDLPMAAPPALGPTWWRDFDGDGDADPLVCTVAGENRVLSLYRRTGEAYLLVHSVENADCVAAWGDYDGDGDDDLAYGSLRGENGATVIERNDGTGGFVEVATAPSHIEMSMAWGRCTTDATQPCFHTTGSQR